MCPSGGDLPRSADHGGHAAAVRAGREAEEEIRGGRPLPQPRLQLHRSLVSTSTITVLLLVLL